MSSLMMEYQKRHNLNFILPVEDSVCFFEHNKLPQGVCLLSSVSRSRFNCLSCEQCKHGIILEMVTVSQSNCIISHHSHIMPDIDIVDYVNKNLKPNVKLEPFYASNKRDIESWLWKYYLMGNSEFIPSRWRAKNDRDRYIEQVMYCVTERPKVLNNYYYKVFSPLLVNRKYLLFM